MWYVMCIAKLLLLTSMREEVDRCATHLWQRSIVYKPLRGIRTKSVQDNRSIEYSTSSRQSCKTGQFVLQIDRYESK